jgi:hypothetical protein
MPQTRAIKLLGIAIIAVLGAAVYGYLQFTQVDIAGTSGNADATRGHHVDVSLSQLLNVTEVRQTAVIAHLQQRPELLQEMQIKLLDTARQLSLSQENLDFIASEQLIHYLRYHAKRDLFNRAVQQAYLDLEHIEEIKTAFPEARDLFANADRLVAERDRLIREIALVLANQEHLSIPTRAHTIEAQQIWLARVTQSQNL